MVLSVKPHRDGRVLLLLLLKVGLEYFAMLFWVSVASVHTVGDCIRHLNALALCVLIVILALLSVLLLQRVM